LSLSLVLIALAAAPEARAQESIDDCGITSLGARDYEIGFVIRGGAERVDVGVTDVWDGAEFDRWTTTPDVFATVQGHSLGCNWVAHTTGTGPGYQGPVAVMPPNRLY